MNLLKLIMLAWLTFSGASSSVKQEGAAAVCGIRIAQRARALQPGEVVLLTVESPIPQSYVEAVVFGKTLARILRG